MIVLVNTNTMTPSIAPIGLDYLAGGLRREKIEFEIVDLAWAKDTKAALKDCLEKSSPELVGLSFRNADDCIWPSGQWFVPHLAELVTQIKKV